MASFFSAACAKQHRQLSYDLYLQLCNKPMAETSHPDELFWGGNLVMDYNQRIVKKEFCINTATQGGRGIIDNKPL